ncbi:MAG: hypothetical protein ACFFAJ_15290 [Candidatus Hodarchaeota archaeon]
MSRKRSRKTLLEISNQPELWIFSNLLAEEWVTNNDLKQPVFEKQVNMPISLPSGTCIFKIESDGPRGIIISISIIYGSEIHLFQIMDPAHFSDFRQSVLNYVKEIYHDNFDFYSYSKSYYINKMKEFGITSILGRNVTIKDLSDYGVKSRILQRISDPIQGYEVPQFFRINQRLASLTPKNPREQDLISNLRTKVCDSLAKHAVIEGLRCAVIALKHYADLLDSLTSETRINFLEEYQYLADGLYKLKDYQNAALFYSKYLSQASLTDESDQDPILTALRESIDQLEPQEFLEYALFAAKIARAHHEEER